MDAQQVVDAVNGSSDRDLQLVGRLGGDAVGAWELIDSAGRREVLKFSADRGWMAHFSRVGAVCDFLRSRGYPAPRVTDSGVVGGVVAYYLQEFVPGRRLAEQRAGAYLSGDAVETMLQLNGLQEGLAPSVRPSGQGWSDYLEACLWGEDHEWAALEALADPAVDELLADVRRVLGSSRRDVFVRDDLVTGSFEPHNVLVDRGTVTAVVDLDAAGDGDRIIDMAALLRFDRSGAHTERILAEAARIGRPWPLRAAIIYWALSSLNLATASGQDPAVAAQRVRRELDIG